MKDKREKRADGGKMCEKEILINGVKAIVDVPDSLLEGSEKSEKD